MGITLAPHDWAHHWKDYLTHYAGAGLAGLLVGAGHWPGVVLMTVMLVYQMGSYWHTEDTLKRDLYDLTLAFSICFCLGVLTWLLPPLLSLLHLT